MANTPEIKAFNVIKGFLNLSLDSAFWAARFREVAANDTFGQAAPTGRTVMIEYSSPNTNKPFTWDTSATTCWDTPSRRS